jgi:hypothetical protein
MGEPLPYTVKLELSPSITPQTFHYTDSCGQPEAIPIGRRIEAALREGARRTFKTVVSDDGGKTSAPDHVINIDIRDWLFALDKDALYDRAPATLRMNAFARIYDKTGTLLRETEFKVQRQERLRLEQAGKNCDYIIDPFVENTAVELAYTLFMDARVALGGASASPPVAEAPPGSSSSPPSGVPPADTSPSPSKLRFKALLLDENSNLILESGEHVRVRVDIVNTGQTPIHNASASLTGTPSVIGQFPATTLTIPPLQPGETKSLEFVATLPPNLQPQQAEIRVSITESGGAAAPSQTLSFTIQPAGAGADDVDQIPAPVSDFHQPQTYLVSIGAGAYRDSRIVSRRYASKDADMVANYFQSLGGVPLSNVRLLQDGTAGRADLDEVLLDWLPLHADKNAIVIVYFSGQAMVAPAGDILLVPHDGRSATGQLYPLKDLESALAKLKAKQILFMFDGLVTRLPAKANAKPAAPHWGFEGEDRIRLIGGEDVAQGLEDSRHRHGLFTYYLLRGLRGEADTNRDNAVTLGELAGYVRQKVAWAAKTQFNAEQRPQLAPSLTPSDKAGSMILTKLAALAGSESP